MKYFRWWVIFIAMAMIVGMLSSPPAHAGQQGWNYQWWDCCGSGSSVVNTPYNNNGGANSAQMYAYGWIKWPGTTTQTSGARTINFGTGWDDNGWLKINGTVVAQYNCCYTAYGSYTANIGDIVKVEMYGNNYGGWTWGFQALWDPQMDGTYQYLDGQAVATTADFWPPPLGLGASASAFSVHPVNAAKINAFVTRTTADSKVTIEQIGNFNVTTIEQTGTKNNYVRSYINGSSNTINITQKANNNTQTDYVDLSVAGNSNNVNIKQRTSNETSAFNKGVFASVNGNNNSLIVDQQNSGSHYAEVNLSGGNKSVNINQSGSASHMASITLSGTATGINLTQQGSTQQFYSVTHNCATAGGCGTVTVTQGQ